MDPVVSISEHSDFSTGSARPYRARSTASDKRKRIRR